MNNPIRNSPLTTRTKGFEQVRYSVEGRTFSRAVQSGISPIIVEIPGLVTHSRAVDKDAPIHFKGVVEVTI